jgi:poly-gamma-glutamate synthesis protein (capsule biosynthesis protein)
VARASLTNAVEIELAATWAENVIVTVHAGTEYSPRPTEWRRARVRAAIDAGADVVIGHHPHVLQPWERYNGGVISYSLGNFVFDLDTDDLATLDSGPFETAVAMITLSPDAPPEVEFHPAYIDPLENRPRPATTEEAAAISEVLRDVTPQRDPCLRLQPR